MNHYILIVDDQPEIRSILSQVLGYEGYKVISAQNGREALEANKNTAFDLVLLDIQLPDMSGIEVLNQLRERNPELLVVMITAYGTVESAVQAMKFGAYDYLQKPLRADTIILVTRKALERKRLLDENKYLHEILEKKYEFQNIIAKNKRMLEIFELIKKVAPSKTTVLIEGESGTGKELMAKAIHFNSPRREAKFVPLNCGGVPETLLESELFGYVRGAFTGAFGSKVGLLEIADNGTIFLDEVATMPVSLQVKLLRVLQENIFFAVGSTKPIEVDIRIIAASNQNLESAVKAGIFREDLYYRLNVIRIIIPPLRERREDIPLLSNHFLTKFNKELGKKIEGFSKSAMESLLRYDWPGNVRELENAVEHAVTLAGSNLIEPQDFPEPSRLSAKAENLFTNLSLHQAKQEFEKQYIIELLKINHGNVTRTAKMAQIARQNMQLKLKEYGIEPKEFAIKKVTKS
ncbi:MAG: sigma-54 dependent transcriptional regulator [Candidatus Edwardsbacteria bacterium]